VAYPPTHSAGEAREAAARRIAQAARTELARELDDPLGPAMLVTMEVAGREFDSASVGYTFVFDVGDRLIRMDVDGQERIWIVNEDFQFVQDTSPARWHNEAMPADVNRDGNVTPIDVLAIINAINAGRAPRLPSQAVLREVDSFVGRVSHAWDVSGDGLITPLDLLKVVNTINHRNRAEGEGFAAAVDLLFTHKHAASTAPEPAGAVVSLSEDSTIDDTRSATRATSEDGDNLPRRFRTATDMEVLDSITLVDEELELHERNLQV
jgi:hypothetical protein